MQKNTARPLAIGLVVLAALARMAQSLNFAPVGAMSLFAGARLRGWQAYALPIVLMAVTDPFLRRLFRRHAAGLREPADQRVDRHAAARDGESGAIGSAAVAGSIQFFLITNFAWLAASSMYPHTLAGWLPATPPAFRSSGGPGVGPAVFGRPVRPARLAEPHRGAARADRGHRHRLV